MKRSASITDAGASGMAAPAPRLGRGLDHGLDATGGDHLMMKYTLRGAPAGSTAVEVEEAWAASRYGRCTGI